MGYKVTFAFPEGLRHFSSGVGMISPVDFQWGQVIFPEGPEGQGNFSSRV
jgi:hypothetical protein